MVQDDIKEVFLNKDEFADLHTVIYDGERYEDIPIVITGVTEKNRRKVVRDHGDRIQGFYMVTTVIHVAVSDLNGVVPEKGMKIQINDGSFFDQYTIVSCNNDLGMLRIELEAIDE